MKISTEYLQQQQVLHQNPSYGIASLSYAPIVAQVVKQFNIQSLSDYGAGKRRLMQGLMQAGILFALTESSVGLKYFPYDPVFPEYGEPCAADLVCCIDVLEHIEPECLEDVLIDLKSITTHLGFFTVHTGPAIKVLSDGRNAHLIQQPFAWWQQKLAPYFVIQQVEHSANGFWMIVKAVAT